jgi:hypothetical protein
MYGNSWIAETRDFISMLKLVYIYYVPPMADRSQYWLLLAVVFPQPQHHRLQLHKIAGAGEWRRDWDQPLAGAGR